MFDLRFRRLQRHPLICHNTPGGMNLFELYQWQTNQILMEKAKASRVISNNNSNIITGSTGLILF